MEERIQKIMAAAGIASRRAAEEIILEGRVRVNGQVVTELGAKADPDKDHIKVDGKLINPQQPKTYIMLNKPAGCVTTMFDPEGRPTVTELLKGVKTRVYPVGRLDYDTEGLLLLTNDGELAYQVTHPRHELPKTYLVKVKGVLEDGQIERLEQGVFLKDGKTAPAKIKKVRKEESNSWIEITIHEGRKRQVRRMIDHTGHSVIKLKRVRVGTLALGDLPLSTFRYLTTDEVAALKEMAQGGQAAGETVKPSSRPAASRHMPEFIEGPRPGRRPKKKAIARPAGRQQGEHREFRSGQGEKRFSKPAFAGSDRPFTSRGPRKDEGTGAGRAPARSFGSRPPYREQGDRRPGRAPGGQGEKRFAKPSFAGEARPFTSRGPRKDEGAGAGRAPGRTFGSRPPYREQGDRRPGRAPGGEGEKRFAKPSFGGDRPFKSRGPRKDEGTGAGRGPARSFGSRTSAREQDDRRPRRTSGGQDERRTGKPFFKGGDRPFRRPDERTGQGARPGSGRTFGAAGPRMQERGARPDAGARRPVGRTEFQRDDRSRRPAAFGSDRGPRKARPDQGSGDRPRTRPGAGPRPAGTQPRGTKGPARRRS